MKILKVTNERRNFILKRGQERYCLSFDTFRYTNAKNNRVSEIQVEIEIESLTGVANKKLAHIRRNLLPILGTFKYSTNSKYERGVECFSLNESLWRQWLNEWNSGIGLTWVGVILGVIGILISIVLYLVSQ